MMSGIFLYSLLDGALKALGSMSIFETLGACLTTAAQDPLKSRGRQHHDVLEHYRDPVYPRAEFLYIEL